MLNIPPKINGSKKKWFIVLQANFYLSLWLETELKTKSKLAKEEMTPTEHSLESDTKN